MEKTDLSTIDREAEPNLYRFCEWANGEIDKGLQDLKVTLDGGGLLRGEHVLPKRFALVDECGTVGPELTRDQFAAQVMAIIDAPIVPGHPDGLFT